MKVRKQRKWGKKDAKQCDVMCHALATFHNRPGRDTAGEQQICLEGCKKQSHFRVVHYKEQGEGIVLFTCLLALTFHWPNFTIFLDTERGRRAWGDLEEWH